MSEKLIIVDDYPTRRKKMVETFLKEIAYPTYVPRNDEVKEYQERIALQAQLVLAHCFASEKAENESSNPS